MGAYAGTPEEMRRVFAMAHRQLIKPPIATVFPLAEAATAHILMEEAKHFGKIVLQTGESHENL